LRGPAESQDGEEERAEASWKLIISAVAVWYQEALAEPDPARSLRLYARNVVRMQQQRYADLDEVLQMAAAADELSQLWQITEDQRRTGAGFIIDALLRKGPLKPGLDLSAITASDIAQAVDLYFYASAGRTSVSAAFRFRQSRKAA
jgi:hypothetical protein